MLPLGLLCIFLKTLTMLFIFKMLVYWFSCIKKYPATGMQQGIVYGSAAVFS